MRHRVKTSTFSRDTKHRKALLRNGVENLVLHGKVVTTKAKAKEFKRWADKLIHTAQAGSVAARRELHEFFGKRDVVNTLVDRIAPVFTDRVSGFTRIVIIGKRRGDNTEMVSLELVNKPESMGSFTSPAEVREAKVMATVKKPVVKKPTAVKPAAADEKEVAKKPAVKKAAVKKPFVKKAASTKKVAAKKK